MSVPESVSGQEREAETAKPKVSLGDLLNEIGGEKIRYQVLGHVLDGEQRTRKNGTTCFKFASMENLSDVMAGRREALIVWTDGGEIEAARQRLIERYGPSPKQQLVPPSDSSTQKDANDQR